MDLEKEKAKDPALRRSMDLDEQATKANRERDEREREQIKAWKRQREGAGP
jgi:hypothetical protein